MKLHEARIDTPLLYRAFDGRFCPALARPLNRRHLVPLDGGTDIARLTERLSTAVEDCVRQLEELLVVDGERLFVLAEHLIITNLRNRGVQCQGRSKGQLAVDHSVECRLHLFIALYLKLNQNGISSSNS